MTKKFSEKIRQRRRSYSLRPSALTDLGVAVVVVERSGSATSRVAAIYDDDGSLVDECKFVSNISQPIALRAGADYEMRWRAGGMGSYHYRIVSTTSGSVLGRTTQPGVSPNAGSVGFTAS